MLNASVKMRVNKEANPKCSSCGCKRKQAVEVFDVCIGSDVFTMCNFCMEVLFNKTLKATCQVNAKLKSQDDLKVIAARKDRTYG